VCTRGPCGILVVAIMETSIFYGYCAILESTASFHCNVYSLTATATQQIFRMATALTQLLAQWPLSRRFDLPTHPSQTLLYRLAVTLCTSNPQYLVHWTDLFSRFGITATQTAIRKFAGHLLGLRCNKILSYCSPLCDGVYGSSL